MASPEFTGASQTDLAYSVGQSLGARSRYVVGELWAFHQGVMVSGAHSAYILYSFYVVQLGMAVCVLEVFHGSVIGGVLCSKKLLLSGVSHSPIIMCQTR